MLSARAVGAAVALLAVWAAGCGRVADVGGEPAEVLVFGTVRTLEDGRPAEAVALRDGRIAAVGARSELEALRGPDTRSLELADGVVAPAFTDHHVHLLNLGMSLLNREEDGRLFLDLSDVGSLDQVGERVGDRAEGTEVGGWVLGKGWSQGFWGTQALPDREVLDGAAPDTPVFLTRLDGHAGWTNRAGLEASGLLEAESGTEAGEVRRRPDGAPSGVLLERANEPVIAELPAFAAADVQRAFRLAAGALAARGVVEAYDAGFLAPPGVTAMNADLARYLELLVAADREEPLPLRVRLMVAGPSDLAREVMERPDDFRALTPRIGVTHIKLFADGALGSRGAALTHGYADDPATRGVPRMGADEILAWSRRAVEAGLGVATHAIGDEAVRRTLDAYERLLEERPELDPRRLRIEHFSYAREEDFSRAVDLGLLFSIQSNFNSPGDLDPSFAEQRVGREGEPRVYAWRRLHEMGARLAEGSDHFGLPAAPLWNFHRALTGRNALGTFGEGLAGRLEAFRLQARRWPPDGGPPRPGRIRPGDTADLAIFSVDPLAVPVSALMDVTVRATLSAGEVVHDDGSLGGLP